VGWSFEALIKYQLGKAQGAGGTELEDATNRAKLGDIVVESPWARPMTITGDRFGQWANFGPRLVVKLKLTNTSPTKMVHFGTWQETATLEDEHKNSYRAMRLGADFGGFFAEFARSKEDEEHNKGCVTDAIRARNLTLRPGKSYITYLFYEEPASVSTEAWLSLPAREVGGSGIARPRVPITRR
jgi:hypothetical protein